MCLLFMNPMMHPMAIICTAGRLRDSRAAGDSNSNYFMHQNCQEYDELRS